MGYDTPWAEALDPAQGRLEELAPGLWWAWSRLRSPPLPRNLVVARLPDGGLLLHSPVCLAEPEMARLEALGPVRLLLIPSGGHRTDSRRFRARYPSARVIAPRAAVRAVEEVVPVDASCEDTLPELGVEWHAPEGMRESELVYQIPLAGGGRALVANDVLASAHPHGPGGLRGALVSLLGTPGGQLGLPRIVGLRLSKDRGAFRAFLERLAAIPDLRALTTSHGAPITGDVAGQLRAAAARLG